MNFKNWIKTHKPHTAGIALAAVVLITLIALGVSGALGHKTTTAKSEKPVATQSVTKEQDVHISVKADEGWTKDSSPVILHVATSDDKTENAVDFYHAVSPSKDNEATDTLSLAEGQYTVEVISPLNADGSAMVAYDTSGDKAKAKASPSVVRTSTITVKADTKDKTAKPKDDATTKAAIDVNLTKLPADKVTDEMVKTIVNKTKVAVDNGDATLKGDAGKDVLKKVEAGAKANPNVSAKTKEKAEESAKTADTSMGSAKETTPAPKPEAPTASNGTKQTSSEPAPKPAEKAKTWVPEKGHWENVTEKVWVPNVVTVVDTPAWDERVESEPITVFAYDNYRPSSNEDYEAHAIMLIQNGHPDNYSVIYEYTTVHHEAVTHTEDQGHYETKVTSRKWVVDEAGHWE